MNDRNPTRRAGLRSVLVLSIAVALTIEASPASAHLGTFSDAKDASTRLDLKEVSLRFHPATHRYVWRFSTFERFRLRNGGTFVLFIDSVGGPRWDFRLYVWDDSGSSGIFCDGQHRPGSGGGERFQPTRWRVKPKSGWCRAKGIRRDKPIAWRVITVQHQGKPFGHALDHAPDVGWF